jgi:cytochrome c553
MKRYLVLGGIIVASVACNNNSGSQHLQSKVDSLENKLKDTYKPGFGEFMSGIQVHHAKLWFAGINNNWELADFEIHEITEALDNLKKFQPERKEVTTLPIINPALDSLAAAIKQKSISQFKNSYILLTNSCNTCHKAVGFSFNEVKIPETPLFPTRYLKRNLFRHNPFVNGIRKR